MTLLIGCGALVSEIRAVLAQVDGVLAQVDGVLAQVDGVLAQVDGVLAPVDGVLAQVDGVLAQVDGVLAPVDGVLAPVEVRYLPANLHNRPERIVDAIDALLAERSAAGRPDVADAEIVLGYADCGTGGGIDRWLARHEGARRLPGAHCYEFLAGAELFARLHDAEPGTFYLTDFLAKQFELLVWQGLGIADHPELLPMYFGNYRRLVLLSQSDDESVMAAAQEAALRLGLAFEHHHVGRKPLERSLRLAVAS